MREGLRAAGTAESPTRRHLTQRERVGLLTGHIYFDTYCVCMSLVHMVREIMSANILAIVTRRHLNFSTC